MGRTEVAVYRMRSLAGRKRIHNQLLDGSRWVLRLRVGSHCLVVVALIAESDMADGKNECLLRACGAPQAASFAAGTIVV